MVSIIIIKNHWLIKSINPIHGNIVYKKIKFQKTQKNDTNFNNIINRIHICIHNHCNIPGVVCDYHEIAKKLKKKSNQLSYG